MRGEPGSEQRVAYLPPARRGMQHIGIALRTCADVVGMPQSRATQVLATRHLIAVPQQGVTSRPPGLVFEQSPRAGNEVSERSRVVIRVSGATSALGMADVSGLTVATATRELRASHYRVIVDRARPSHTVKRGLVITTDPPPSDSVEIGSAVHLVPSSGTATRPVDYDGTGAPG